MMSYREMMRRGQAYLMFQERLNPEAVAAAKQEFLASAPSYEHLLATRPFFTVQTPVSIIDPNEIKCSIEELDDRVRRYSLREGSAVMIWNWERQEDAPAVWEVFSEVSRRYPFLTWSHFTPTEVKCSSRYIYCQVSVRPKWAPLYPVRAMEW